jgi:hypothetical protein
MQFTFKREAIIMAVLHLVPVFLGLFVKLIALSFFRR